MYQKTLERFYQKCEDYTIGGIVEAYVQRRSAIGEYWFYKEANSSSTTILTDFDTDNQPSILTDYSVLAKSQTAIRTYNWNKLFIRDTSTLNIEQTVDIPRLYTYTLNLDIAQFDVLKRAYLERMVVAKDCVFIIKDYNGSYYVVGETNGCRVKVGMTTDTKRGDNRFTVTAVCNERALIRELDKEFASNYLFVNNTIDTDIFDNLQVSSGNSLNKY